MSFRGLRLAGLGAVLVAAASGCNRGDQPNIQDPGDQTAVVGQQFTLHVIATDKEGDDISWDVDASGVPDWNGMMGEAPDGSGVLTWTPVASQVGSQIIDIEADDGKHKDPAKLSVLIEVVGATGSGSQPIFRKPLGTGTVLDLEQNDCVSFDIQIEDPDSTSVELGEMPPLIADANLDPDSDGLTGSWSWCPSREQTEADDRYDLKLTADDGDNPPVEKPYSIVLRKRKGENCPGEAPVIEHTPADHDTLLDLEINAQISDDQGLKDLPYLCWSPVHPGDPIDFNIMTLQTMTLRDGNMMNGSWQGFITNPTAQQMGASAPMYYLITASDDDDAEGDCDHLTDNPATGVHEVGITNNGGETAGLCEHCSFDIQCGGSGDLCLAATNGSFCGTSCDGGGSCPSGYTCSPQPVESVDGASARQCVPDNGSCGGGGGGNCSDDGDEENDTPTDAVSIGSSVNGNTLCAGDEDWYAIEVGSASQVHVELSGEDPPDMDVSLTTAGGVLIKSSSGLDSEESFTTTCLDPGTYLIRVYTVSTSGSGTYDLSWSTMGCGGGGGGMGDCCVDNNSPGCEDPAIESCVCAIDSFCCDTEWDNMCASTATSDCDACGGGGTGGGDTGCCTSHMTAGCDDAAIETCVCNSDAFCCSTQWDAVCVGKVGSLLCAPSCNPDDADGACCADNGTPGCEVNTVEMCVCNEDPFCCSDMWDQFCVDAIGTNMCGTCPA